MTSEQERWADALMVNRIHGARASRHVVERIAALENAGDRAGAARWLEIAERLDQLIRPASAQ